MRAEDRRQAQAPEPQIIGRDETDFGFIPWLVLVVLVVAVEGCNIAGDWVGGVILVLGVVLAGVAVVVDYLHRQTREESLELFRRWATARNRFGVLVTSESPKWKSYIEGNWLPRIGQHVSVLNWSSCDGDWGVVETTIFELASGNREFCPLLVIPCEGESVAVYRFFQAFRAMKHGDMVPLEIMERRMFEAYEGWLESSASQRQNHDRSDEA